MDFRDYVYIWHGSKAEMEYLERLVVKSELHVRDVTQPGR
jgi:hypothetical protein